jgi:hypothetical protein
MSRMCRTVLDPLENPASLRRDLFLGVPREGINRVRAQITAKIQGVCFIRRMDLCAPCASPEVKENFKNYEFMTG